MDKFAILFQLHEVLRNNKVSDHTLYSLLEKLNLLFAQGPQFEESLALDTKVLTIALIELLSKICRIIHADDTDSKVCLLYTSRCV